MGAPVAAPVAGVGIVAVAVAVADRWWVEAASIVAAVAGGHTAITIAIDLASWSQLSN